MTAHRYWRVKFRANAGGLCATGQIQMATERGGDNVALGGVALADSEYGGNVGAYGPQLSFNGDTGTCWVADGAAFYDGHWIGYDFGADVQIREVRIRTAPRGDGPQSAPNIFDFESSDDGLSWLFEYTGYLATWNYDQTYTFALPTIKAANRFWAVYCEQNVDFSRSLSAAEIGFREAIGGPNVATVTGATSFPSPDFPLAYLFDGNLATQCFFAVPNANGKATMISVDLVEQTTIAELAISMGNENLQKAIIAGRVMYSDDGFGWSIGTLINAAGWNAGQTQTWAVNIVPTVLHAGQARNLVIYNIPTVEIRAGFAAMRSVQHGLGHVDATQLSLMAVTKGRVQNPRLRLWTFTLAGHDFVVLRLGDNETLIYDTSTEQWVNWDSANSGAWRPNIGFTWVDGQAFGNSFGSNIVVGDDTFGLLWFLDPRRAWDEHPDPLNTKQQVPFQRIVTGQVLAAGREAIPCYAAFLDGDNYGIEATDFIPSIVLETSDDQGRTFDAHEALPVLPAYTWYSLGQITSPGRMFRITDNGVLTRIDALEMNDDR